MGSLVGRAFKGDRQGFGKATDSMPSLRLACVIAAGIALSGCAAGHIEPFSKPVQSVTVGLTEAQTELRVSGDALKRTPWLDPEQRNASLSLTSVFTVLVDGLGAVTGQGGDQAETPVRPALAHLSEPARAYVERLDAHGERPGLQLAAVETDLAGRIKITRRFLTAASQVLASHRLEASDRAGFVHHARDDMALIADVADTLQTQHRIFTEVTGALTVAGGSSSMAVRGLGVWYEDIVALDLLAKSVSDTTLS